MNHLIISPTLPQALSAVMVYYFVKAQQLLCIELYYMALR